MATYITIFLFELILVYISWFVLKRILRKTKLDILLVICLVISFVGGYIAAYRIIGYEVAMDHLTRINNQKIELTGEGITLEEENEYKKVLVKSKELEPYLVKNAFWISLPPFIIVVLIVLSPVGNAIKKIKPNEKETKDN